MHCMQQAPAHPRCGVRRRPRAQVIRQRQKPGQQRQVRLHKVVLLHHRHLGPPFLCCLFTFLLLLLLLLLRQPVVMCHIVARMR